ncbi:Mucin-associated surface protein (MASP) [Trypanosoma cruzi]|uniref:Mucin-associated surface protein (MASP), putative n=2 Tax=Trypanosoma cruzi TaxID=5693 RepID=Q4DNF3_TRYCC|nr:mucin-associated surface protein (MASP), putative [Trypanosoma cruzi]EAN94060.1 mucin-associated surface protein (MASP), putative [Trypanosoma cruzi]PWV21200.1 Mucin-associated surface protein (MASP) [Trypanosoma cruzi]RNC42195.1 mucin-associated surface protein (MASP) [Trypanosoma cruzi]|eukprot:XP_815911.1 mucin-associated surface protein (MASP) [Trypanosoma cruzi strain CL Brener]
MAMMMTGRVLLVCALCVLWCGVFGIAAEEVGGADGSAVEYSFAGRHVQLRRGCAEEVNRRTGGGANASAVEECVRRGTDGVRAVVDGRSRWRRQQFAVAAAADGVGDSGDKSGEGSDVKLKVLSSSDQMLEAGQDPEEGQEHTGSPEVTKTLETNKDSQKTEEQNVSPDGDRSKQPESQEPAVGQPEGEGNTRNPQPRQPPPGTNKLQSEETHPPITAEKHSKSQDGRPAQETKVLQTKGSTKHEEGASSLHSSENVSHLSRESTTPLSTSTESSNIAGSTVEKSGAKNSKTTAASVTQHDSEGDTGPAALPASTSELQSDEISNAGIIAATHRDGDDDSSPAASIAERPTAGTRSTKASGDASDLDQSNNDDVNDDVAHNGKTAEFEAASGTRDNKADNNERYTAVTENATNKSSNTETTADSDSSTAVSHTTSPLLLLLVACAAAAAVVAA